MSSEKEVITSSVTTEGDKKGNGKARKVYNRRGKTDRNKNKNKVKNEGSTSTLEGSTSTSETSEIKEESLKLNESSSEKKSKNSKKSTNKSDKPRVKPLLKELEKIIPIINPITINGLPTKNLSNDVLTFIKNIINDKSNKDEIFMTFFMKPSDPDFPFDIELLTITLCIPQTYPNRLPSPTIMILNDDIPRGYSANIEIGFKKIVSTILENRQNKKNGVNSKAKEIEKKEKANNKNKNNKDDDDDENENEEEEKEFKIDIVGGNDLSGMIKTLDKYLEKFLSMEKKDTIKLVKVINNSQHQQQQQQANKRENQVKDQMKNENFEKGHTSPASSNSSTVDTEKYKKRKEELDIFRQKLKDNSIIVTSDNARGTTYKMILYFKNDNLTVEFDESEEVTIEKLYVKIFVPKEYLTNPKKGIKLSVDMSNNYNIGLINSIEDTSVRLIFGKLINNISGNYDTFSLDIASINCNDSDRKSNTYWTITSQLNFFVHNIQKFMNERRDFQHWYSANKEMNTRLV